MQNNKKEDNLIVNQEEREKTNLDEIQKYLDKKDNQIGKKDDTINVCINTNEQNEIQEKNKKQNNEEKIKNSLDETQSFNTNNLSNKDTPEINNGQEMELNNDQELGRNNIQEIIEKNNLNNEERGDKEIKADNYTNVMTSNDNDKLLRNNADENRVNVNYKELEKNSDNLIENKENIKNESKTNETPMEVDNNLNTEEVTNTNLIENNDNEENKKFMEENKTAMKENKIVLEDKKESINENVIINEKQNDNNNIQCKDIKLDILENKKFEYNEEEEKKDNTINWNENNKDKGKIGIETNNDAHYNNKDVIGEIGNIGDKKKNDEQKIIQAIINQEDNKTNTKGNIENNTQGSNNDINSINYIIINQDEKLDNKKEENNRIKQDNIIINLQDNKTNNNNIENETKLDDVKDGNINNINLNDNRSNTKNLELYKNQNDEYITVNSSLNNSNEQNNKNLIFKNKEDNTNIDNSNDEEEEDDDNKKNIINYYDDYENDSKICGIKNIGNNCYFNSGLQILASCKEIINLLNSKEYEKTTGKIIFEFKNAMKSLLNEKIYNPENFLNYFCKINSDFRRGSQGCSQNFIRTLIRNINKECIDNNCELVLKNDQYPKRKNKEYKEYEKFVEKIYPESKAISLFSGITKSHSKGKCPKCREKIDNYSFSYFIDQNMYLDEFDSDCEFSDVLEANIGNNNILTMDCPKCGREIEIKEDTKIIKIPDILIFTLERYQGPTNKVMIEPDKKLEMKDYIDNALNIENTEYQLFAINIRFGSTANYGHEICQVNRDGKWYEINDRYGKEIENISHFDSSYGLFYRKIKNDECQNNNIDDNDDNEIIEINNKYSNAIKLIEKKDEESKWSCFGYFFNDSSNEEKVKICNVKLKKNKYLGTGLHIISSCEALAKELGNCNIKKKTITSVTKLAIYKILVNSEYDAYDFMNIFFKTNENYKEDKEYSSQKFILTLIDNINKEFIYMKSNLYQTGNLKYNPNKNNEIYEFNKFIKNVFPESIAFFIF